MKILVLKHSKEFVADSMTRLFLLTSKCHTCRKPIWELDGKRIGVLAWLKWVEIWELHQCKALVDYLRFPFVVLVVVCCLFSLATLVCFLSLPFSSCSSLYFLVSLTKENVLMTIESNAEFRRRKQWPLQIHVDLALNGRPRTVGQLIASQLYVYLSAFKFFEFGVR